VNRQQHPWLRLTLLCLAALFVSDGLRLGIRHETQVVNQTVNEVSDLRDPSPFRAALLGQLGKIQLSLKGYLRNPESSPEKQVNESRDEFESLLPEFVRQNPKLFPQTAAEEIRRTFGQYKEAIIRTRDTNSRRMEQRDILDKNFAQILYLIDHNLRPLIRKNQADGEERSDAVLNIENQTRAWHENLAKAWARPTDAAKALTFENDNRGQSFLELYARMELLPRERKIQKELYALWMTNSDLARESYVREGLVSQMEKAMDGTHDQVVTTLNQFLPAMPPGELEAKKQKLMRAMKWQLVTAGGIGLLGLGILIFLTLTAYRLFQNQEPPPPKKTTIQMDLQGKIADWSREAKALYGYTADEMRGQSIGSLFESESEINRLDHELHVAKKTTFETTHKTKSGASLLIRIEFRPVMDPTGRTIAIGLICSRR